MDIGTSARNLALNQPYSLDSRTPSQSGSKASTRGATLLGQLRCEEIFGLHAGFCARRFNPRIFLEACMAATGIRAATLCGRFRSAKVFGLYAGLNSRRRNSKSWFEACRVAMADHLAVACASSMPSSTSLLVNAITPCSVSTKVYGNLLRTFGNRRTAGLGPWSRSWCSVLVAGVSLRPVSKEVKCHGWDSCSCCVARSTVVSIL